jgi:hypothetical protein
VTAIAAPLYAWLIRNREGATPVLALADLSARFVFADLGRAIQARDELLAMAERHGIAFDLYVLSAAIPLLSIDPEEWRHDDPHVPLDPAAPAEEPRS